MPYTADEVPFAIVAVTGVLARGSAVVGAGWPMPPGWTNLVGGGMLPYGTHALLPPGGEGGMNQPDASGAKFGTATFPNGPSGINPVVPPPV